MSAGKVIGYIFAAITIFFGVLFIWSAFGPEEQPGNILIGILSAGIGFGLIWYLGRKKATADEEVKLQIDLSGDINLDTLSCESCGGHLSPDNISMLAGAPVVSCPFCGTSYQLTEEPKW